MQGNISIGEFVLLLISSDGPISANNTYLYTKEQYLDTSREEIDKIITHLLNQGNIEVYDPEDTIPCYW